MPVRVPPETVIVKLPLMLAPSVAVPLNVPDPMLVSVAGPVTVIAVPTETVALVTVNVVDIDAALASAPNTIAIAQL